MTHTVLYYILSNRLRKLETGKYDPDFYKTLCEMEALMEKQEKDREKKRKREIRERRHRLKLEQIYSWKAIAYRFWKKVKALCLTNS